MTRRRILTLITVAGVIGLLGLTHSQWSSAALPLQWKVSQRDFSLAELAYAEAHHGQFATAVELVRSFSFPMAAGYQVRLEGSPTGRICAVAAHGHGAELLSLRVQVTSAHCPSGLIAAGTLIGRGMTRSSVVLGSVPR